MTFEESVKLLALIKLAYPNSYRDIDKDTQLATVNMWQRAFCNVPFAVMELALDHFVKGSKFPPTIAEICEELKGIHSEALINVLTLEQGNERDFYLKLMQHTEQFKESYDQRIKPNFKLVSGVNQPLIEG